MKESQNSSIVSGKQPQEKGKPAEQEVEESCRCKEASKKTPLELLKMMMSDLSFWKKERK